MAQHDPHPTSRSSSSSSSSDPPAGDAKGGGSAAEGFPGGGAAVPCRPAKQNPAGRSFVVELTDDDAVADRFSGRVQHLATLDGGNFSSAETLVAIMRRVLDRVRRDREP